MAASLLERLARIGRDPPGITRASYGPEEGAAHALVAAGAAALGCEVRRDWAGNTICTLPGRDRAAPGRAAGSHLDTVAHGGAYDGAAGVAAGLAALAAQDGPPPVDCSLIAFRAEESVWFPVAYPGSRAAAGTLPPGVLGVRRAGGGVTLGKAIAAAGGDPSRAGSGPTLPLLEGFCEVHIEQGPVLAGMGAPVGMVTGVFGGRRFSGVRIAGDWAHSGATPRAHRADAAAAFARIAVGTDALWAGLGAPATATFGMVATDPALHGASKVAGELTFTLDLRALEAGTLAALEAGFRALCAVEAAVRVEIPDAETWEGAAMDAGLTARIAGERGVPRMPSGAGHDAAALAMAGVPTAMIFVRSANGSHNPDEAMDVADLEVAAGMLAAWFAQ